MLAYAACLCACGLDTGQLRGHDAGLDAGQDAGLDAGVDPERADAGRAAAGPCGRIGAACCAPDNSCEVGGCLRGTCAAFGGVFVERAACDTPTCDTRNSYTAGCACPRGFEAAPPVELAGTCEDGAATARSLVTCVASRSLDAAWGGSFLSADLAGQCDGEAACLAPNPYIQRCGCSDADVPLELTVALAEATCGAPQASLGLCLHASASPARFGGAFLRSAADTSVCVTPNPLTEACTCPEGADPQAVPVGQEVLVWCNL